MSAADSIVIEEFEAGDVEQVAEIVRQVLGECGVSYDMMTVTVPHNQRVFVVDKGGALTKKGIVRSVTIPCLNQTEPTWKDVLVNVSRAIQDTRIIMTVGGKAQVAINGTIL